MSGDPRDDELPSYEEVIKEEERLQAQPPRPPRPATSAAPRPQQRPSTVPSSSTSHTHTQSHSYTSSSSHVRPPPKPQQNPSLPWAYPPRFYCSKCGNTGYKIKNGRSCKSCWRRFAPQNNAVTAPTYYSNYTMPVYTSAWQGNRPLYVQPGDPRLGGVLCGECRGSGRTRFLLDEDICPLCHGVGRIITQSHR
ncbi:Hua1p SKDI_07G5160 [Saccharomyces kudriavzevii IFO 1802]|uniref:HUA1-like protein n=2 Tax=Saccharomyces kudriavzevii (strain ATCC MYA-4449 / AS 2.2408 / CBS 8840 / NBRC 1802 / NCYC 2889) TaxID=226230 RepID=J6EHJ8_SACK1|nr:uncharacterized protein SKDI_07G5160 [Saccharomyces kudriavzevii IFO 1802]EJT42867.1 HUA1-like protein [Saccharomyces kudriavzevii IFO 1802]CAI4063042.1 hypothetical protein SKDI_07G5160 [Saccharomyces kudriavzevii IFO 1802]